MSMKTKLAHLWIKTCIEFETYGCSYCSNRYLAMIYSLANTFIRLVHMYSWRLTQEKKVSGWCEHPSTRIDLTMHRQANDSNYCSLRTVLNHFTYLRGFYLRVNRLTRSHDSLAQSKSNNSLISCLYII